MSDEAVGELRKDVRLFRGGVSVLRRMTAVIDSDTEDLAGISNHGQEFDVLQPAVGFGALRKLQHLVQHAFFSEGFTERVILVSETIRQRDHADIGYQTESRFAVRDIARQFHVPRSAYFSSGLVTMSPTPALLAQ